MKNQTTTRTSAQTVPLQPFSIQTGTEACAGPREGVIVVFATPPQTTSKGSSKPF